MVAACVQSSAELCRGWLLRPPELDVLGPQCRRLGRHDRLADSHSSPLESFRRILSRPWQSEASAAPSAKPLSSAGNPILRYHSIRGVDSAGGWTQLKFQLTPKLELNGVFAEDNAFAGDIRGFAIDMNNFGTILGRNRGAARQLVYRPRSDLLLSAEFRRLHSFPIYDSASVTNQINLAMGILF